MSAPGRIFPYNRPMSRRAEILAVLADGAFHSGPALAQRLGVSRTAVGKQLARLRALGLEVEAVRGRGYRLPVPCRLLTRAAILRALGAEHAARWRRRLVVLERVDSTNRYLLARGPGAAPLVCTAELQTAGRGRRGRGWAATPYHNVLFSMSWRLAGGTTARVGGLALAAAVAVLHALEEIGVRGAGLKWPNDVLWQGRKLAGILIETQGGVGGPTHVVLGVGINGYLGPAATACIDQPWVDLYRITGAVPDRNRLVARLIVHLAAMFERFAVQGLAPFRPEWESRHLFTGRTVRLFQDGMCVEGIVEGVDEGGALRLRLPAEHGGGVRRFFAGELSLRPA